MNLAPAKRRNPEQELHDEHLELGNLTVLEKQGGYVQNA